MRAGDVIADRFQVEGVAGSGGMGTVYRTLDRDTGKPAAVKILERLTLDHARRFERESWILSELDHPGVVGYLGHGVTDDGRPYLAMQWLSGEDLRQRLDRGPLPIPDVVAIGRQVASALAEAHRRGIVHRDIKPGNLFLEDGGTDRVRVLDFGIARFSQPALDATQFGVTIGTPSYMSPEQARGEIELDARADVFSLGCVLFECVTGRPPFVGGTLMGMLAKILLEDVPRLRDIEEHVDPRLDDVVARMLEKDPADRTGDMGIVEAELGELADARRTEPVAVQRAPRITKGERRLLSIVATTPRTGASPDFRRDSQTIAGDTSIPSEETDLHMTVSRLGGRVETLADGSHIAIVERRGEATDQAATAARAALALLHQLPGVGVSIATGRGIVAGRLPVGEVIDRAIRLLPNRTHETKHTVRIDETTAALLDSRFVLGRDEHGLRLVAERDVGRGVRTLLGRPTPCVGRDMELAILESLHESCIAEPRAQAVLVTGASGTGKSRLRHEFLDRLRRRDIDAEVILARGQEVAAGSAFGLLAPAMRRVMGLKDGERGEAARETILARVARRVPPGDVERVSEFLGELVCVAFDDDESPRLSAAREDPRVMGDQLEAAFIDFLRAECAARPVVIVIEDLQWGDAVTIRFIDAALRALSNGPLFVLALARPEFGEVFPDLWTEHDVHQLKVKPLSNRASLQLLRNALGPTRDQAFIERLAEKAGGNAFFLEELARAAETHDLETLPDTVLAMVEARLQSLTPESRRVLRAASVLGRAFWVPAVAELLGHEMALGKIQHDLDELARGEFVSVRRGGRFPGMTEYAFRNAVVQEAAYAMLTPGDRSLGHELAARWLESAGETDPTIMAEHFDRGGNHAEASRWLEQAAWLAIEGDAFEVALQHTNRAMGGDPSMTREFGPTVAATLRASLVLARSIALSWQGRFGEARESATLASTLAPRGSANFYRAIEVEVSAASRLGDFALVASRQDDLLTELPAETEDAWASCLGSCARMLFQAGDYEAAKRLLARLSAEVERGTLGPRAVAEVHRLRGARARHVGNVVDDLAWYEASLRAFEEVGETRLACNARISVAFAYIEVGDLGAAEETLARALEEAERYGLATLRTRARQNLGLLRASMGRLEEAQTLFEEVIAESLARGGARFAAWTSIYAANVAYRRGELGRARSEATKAVEALAATPPARAGALAALARIDAAEGKHERALTGAEEARRIVEEFGGIEEFGALVHVAVIESFSGAGRRDELRAATARAREWLEHWTLALPAERRADFLTRVPENARIREFVELVTP